jgi:outer membrane protein OmpA-like peptidoglycan-associated protein
MRKYTILMATVLAMLTGCATTQNTQLATGTAIGAAVGAGVGNLIGKDTKATLIGSAVGAAVGAGVAYQWGSKIQQMLSGLPPESGVAVSNQPTTQPNVPAPVKITLQEYVTFNSNSAILKNDANTQNTIGRVIQAIQAQPYGKVVVVGHADGTGDPAKNQQLSVDRAVALSNALNRGGIDGRKIVPEGHGSREPIADNNTPEGKAQNRRVEVIVYPA